MPDQETQTEAAPNCVCNCSNTNAFLDIEAVFDTIDIEVASTEGAETDDDRDSQDSRDDDWRYEGFYEDIVDATEQYDDVVDQFYLACSSGDSKKLRLLIQHKDVEEVNVLYGIKSVLQWCVDTPLQLQRLVDDLTFLCQSIYPPIDKYDTLLSHVLLYAPTFAYTPSLVKKLLSLSHDPLAWIRAALRCEKDPQLIRDLFEYAIKIGFRLKLSQVVHLTKYGLLKCADNTIRALDVRLALLLDQPNIIDQPVKYEDISKFISLIMEEDMHMTLKVLLRHSENYQVIKGMKRFGIFQDCIERNRCRVIETLLDHPTVSAFYADIIQNLLQRKSHIIKSREMERILAKSAS